jgi:energy-converting hydrogenase Eha subunit H
MESHRCFMEFLLSQFLVGYQNVQLSNGSQITALILLIPVVINRTFSSVFHSYCTLLPQTCEEAQEQDFRSFLYVVCNVGISNLLITTSVNGFTLYFASASFQNKARRNSNTSVQAHGQEHPVLVTALCGDMT